MVTGVAGTGVDADRNKGAMAVFKKNPGIKVVGRYTGMWDSATAQRNTAAQLPSLPKVDGIWAQGGTDGVIKAFIDAKRPLPPTAGEAENGFRKFMTGYQGQKVDGLSIGQPPFLGVIALELAPGDAQGTSTPRSDITIPFPKVTERDGQGGRDGLQGPGGQLLRRLHRLRPERHGEDLRRGRARPASRAPASSRSTSAAG